MGQGEVEIIIGRARKLARKGLEWRSRGGLERSFLKRGPSGALGGLKGGRSREEWVLSVRGRIEARSIKRRLDQRRRPPFLNKLYNYCSCNGVKTNKPSEVLPR